MRVNSVQGFLKRLLVLSEMPRRLSSDALLIISLFFFDAVLMGPVCLSTAWNSVRLVGSSAASMCDSNLNRWAVNGVIRIERST